MDSSSAATTGLGLSLRSYLELRLRMEWPDGGAPASSPERVALAVLDAMEDELRQAQEALAALWGDFELDAERYEAQTRLAQVLGWGDFRECSAAQTEEFAAWAQEVGLPHLGNPHIRKELFTDAR